MTKTNKEKQKDLRDRRRNEGWIKLWIKPEWKKEILEFIEKLKNKPSK